MIKVNNFLLHIGLALILHKFFCCKQRPKPIITCLRASLRLRLFLLFSTKKCVGNYFNRASTFGLFCFYLLGFI
jgi:hypothetical protein